jgi:hypothetical protein
MHPKNFCRTNRQIGMTLNFKEEFRLSQNFSLSPSIGSGQVSPFESAVLVVATNVTKTTVSGVGVSGEEALSQ